MTVDSQDWLDSTPSAVYLLVSTPERVQEVAGEVIEEVDDQPGIQARVSTNSLRENAETMDEAFGHLLRDAKVGSRWGKDILEYYREFIGSMVNSVDENVLEDELVGQFSKYDADPYESAFIGEPLSLGFGLYAELSERLETTGSSCTTFNRTDFAAAIGYTVDVCEIDRTSVGTVLIEFTEPLSKATEHRQLLYLSRFVQELVLLGLSVVMIGPNTGTDEVEQVEEFFRSVGRFDLHELGSISVSVPEEAKSWLGSWYERLCYDVDSGKISGKVARNATATAFNLKHLDPADRKYSNHFINAIEYGLQDQYSEQKLAGAHRDQFNELWDDVVKSHPNYDHFRSQRNSFPRVRVAREDGITKGFVLHHEGALLDLHLNGVPVDSDRDPSDILVETIEAFLNADRVGETQWSALVELVEDRLSGVTEVSSQELVERMLLYQGFLSPTQITATDSSAAQSTEYSAGDLDPEWYRKHWRTILSSHRVRSQAGLSLIKDKQELMEDLEGDDVSTAALYAKLGRDIERAWDHYSNALIEALEAGVTDDVTLEVSQSREKSSKKIDIEAQNSRLGRVESIEIRVYMPYRDVRIDGQRVPRPTVSNATDKVLRSLAGLIGSQVSESIDDVDDLLYDLLVLYEETRASDDQSLVYFDNLIKFCLSIPGVPDLFRNSKSQPEEGLRQALGSQELKQRLERSGSTYHRKGTDPYVGVKVGNDRYIAIELQVREM